MNASKGNDPETRSRDVRIGVDIGGTFTDMVILDEHGIVEVGKVLTTPDEPARAVEQVIRETLSKARIEPVEVSGFVHGTTLVTNALIERRGAQTALLATAGFRDALELRRELRYDVYDIMIEMPEPLVPRWLRFDIPERLYADGTVAEQLDEKHVARIARELVNHGVEAVAIAFLHSYRNPIHEVRAREILQEEAPSLKVAISSEVAPEIREYERMSTTVANVYIQNLTRTYMDDLRKRSSDIGLPREPRIMLSNGGLASIDTAGSFPIRMLESGPAGGALAAAAFGKAAEHTDLLAFDMGGTTAKLCMVVDHEPLVTHQFEIDRIYRMKPGSGLPVNIPVIDMIEIGVGGGSIAHINTLGLVKVGPESASSVPGPVCYGRGGTRPTVTDADLVLGYLDPEHFLGGEMKLDVEGARRAILEEIAQPLGVTLEEAAYGIHSTANENMANAARVHAIERGKDPVGQPIFTSGGAGPVHGAGLAQALGASEIICAPAAGVMGSVGFLTAPLSFDFVRSSKILVDDISGNDSVEAIFQDMEAEGETLLLKSGLSVDKIRHRRFAEMRYEGQGFELRVELPLESSDWHATLNACFTEQYFRRYERNNLNVRAEVLNWRVVSSGPSPDYVLREHRTRSKGQTLASRGKRQVYFPEAGGFTSAAVYDRYTLLPGDTMAGPCIIEERESTLVVPVSAYCRVAPDGSLIVYLNREPLEISESDLSSSKNVTNEVPA